MRRNEPRKDDLMWGLGKVEEGIENLRTYLMSAKFSWPEDQVSTEDVLARIEALSELVRGLAAGEIRKQEAEE